jgi:3-oxoacyl-[acyl-carrier-protein] synthase II
VPGSSSSKSSSALAQVKGYGSTDDAFHITAPKEDGAGPARAFRLALRLGAVDPETVHYVNAHGTSTAYNDVIETRAIKIVFGEHARKIAISSTKSMIGHLLGASSAVELVATALAVHQGRVHPTRNLVEADPECDLDYVPGEAREVPIQNALSNSLGFGGHNVSICLGRVD